MSVGARQYKYTVLLDPDEDEGGFTVTVPALPGVVTQGETVDEALAMARDAIELYIEDLVADGEPIPEERVAPRLVKLSVSEVRRTIADTPRRRRRAGKIVVKRDPRTGRFITTRPFDSAATLDEPSRGIAT